MIMRQLIKEVIILSFILIVIGFLCFSCVSFYNKNGEFNWIEDVINDPGINDCYEKGERLIESGIPKKTIIRQLALFFKEVHLTKNDVSCLLPLLLHFSDESLIDIFKARKNENNESNEISGAYIKSLYRNKVPVEIISKIELLKGRKYFSYSEYETELYKVLDEESVKLYRNDLIYGEKLDPFDLSNDIYFLLISKDMIINDELNFLKGCKKLKNRVSYEYYIELHINKLPVPLRISIIHNLLENKFPNNSMFSYCVMTILENIYLKYPDQYLEYINSHEVLPFELTCVLQNKCP